MKLWTGPRRFAGIDEFVATLPVEAATAVGLVGGVSDIRERLEAYSSAGLDEVALVPMTAADPNGERTLRGERSCGLARRVARVVG